MARLSGKRLRFACSATKHRVPRHSIRHVIDHYRVRFDQPPPVGGPASRSTRIVYLGEDQHGYAIEAMAVELDDGTLLVIHAMPMRRKYRVLYEASPR